MTTETAVREREILGHPAGLYILFFAEMWERFCFYGMRTLLVLYMVSEFMYGDDKAYGVYGAYLALVYLSPIAGGYIADSMIGYRWAVTLGGVIIALGEFSLLVVNEQFFYMGLAAIIVGNGFFKPNISTIVGKLYKDGDPRRDSGFTIFYMGINVGAFISTLVCGYIGERYGWTKGFLLAGIGMLLGLVTFWWGQKFLHGHGNPPSPERFKKTILPVVIGSIVAIPLIYFLLYHQTPYEVPILSSAIGALSQDFAAQPVVGWLLLVTVVGVLGYLFIDALKEDKVQRDRMFVILVLWVFHSLFWAFFEQAGSSLTLFTAMHPRFVPLGQAPRSSAHSMKARTPSVAVSAPRKVGTCAAICFSKYRCSESWKSVCLSPKALYRLPFFSPVACSRSAMDVPALPWCLKASTAASSTTSGSNSLGRPGGFIAGVWSRICGG